MKSRTPTGVAGNVKLRGRTTHTLSCLCCDMVNFKWPERVKEAMREIEEAKKPPREETEK